MALSNHKEKTNFLIGIVTWRVGERTCSPSQLNKTARRQKCSSRVIRGKVPSGKSVLEREREKEAERGTCSVR
ncbi:hypothetical protein AAFF_G00364690 [Aldrovandia affinis]|uniref:Uncharacterized protein n=1 Tax=Aldrovandia affinis TaxID=143900 RepID=A0AAD7SHQ5_9TELE|nr:hypothetical protein AAFF_G00364690 [Aldrovandia affinis]